MTYINGICADVGTANCPCPLAETGDCLVCSRLSGKKDCNCRWAGVCIYNEYIQDGSVVRQVRENKEVKILKKIWYGSDLLVMVLKVTKGFALKAAQPGAFIFVNPVGKNGFSNLPVSIMRTDIERGQIFIAIKVISGKTKAVAEQEEALMIRGIYRNGLLGGGLAGLKEDMKAGGNVSESKKWLVITKGVGFAPAVNLLDSIEGRVKVDFLIDTDKINDQIITDNLQSDDICENVDVRFRKEDLNKLTRSIYREGIRGRRQPLAGCYNPDDYDRVVILTSDYYIKTLAEHMDIPHNKLVFCNNFRMCCGEGVCGACSHVDDKGNVSKMCKCHSVDVKELL